MVGLENRYNMLPPTATATTTTITAAGATVGTPFPKFPLAVAQQQQWRTAGDGPWRGRGGGIAGGAF